MQKKKQLKQQLKKCKYEHDSLTSWYKIVRDGLTCHLKSIGHLILFLIIKQKTHSKFSSTFRSLSFKQSHRSIKRKTVNVYYI